MDTDRDTVMKEHSQLTAAVLDFESHMVRRGLLALGVVDASVLQTSCVWTVYDKIRWTNLASVLQQ